VKTHARIFGTLAAAMVALAVPSVAHADYQGTNGKIAYVDSGIRTMNPDGSAKRLLDANGTDPVWSPTGNRIAYVRGGNIWTMNADGTGKAQVTMSTAVESAPAWNPTGTRLRFYSSRLGGAIYQLSSTKPFGTATLVYVEKDPDFQAIEAPNAWASTGTYALTRHVMENGSCCGSCCTIATWNGTTIHDIGGWGTFGTGSGIDWGPKGTTLATSTTLEDPNDYTVWIGEHIVTVSSTGTNPRELPAPAFTWDENPAWAPAGTWMVFDSHYDNWNTGTSYPLGIWKMKGDGTGRVQISATGTDPNWQRRP
jgi:hypothetical protein